MSAAFRLGLQQTTGKEEQIRILSRCRSVARTQLRHWAQTGDSSSGNEIVDDDQARMSRCKEDSNGRACYSQRMYVRVWCETVTSLMLVPY